MKEELNSQELQKTAGGGDGTYTSPMPSRPNAKRAPIIRYCPQCGEVEVFNEMTTICPKCWKPLTDQA